MSTPKSKTPKPKPPPPDDRPLTAVQRAALDEYVAKVAARGESLHFKLDPKKPKAVEPKETRWAVLGPALAKTTGALDPLAGSALLTQASGGELAHPYADAAYTTEATAALLLGIGPRDELEGMLGAQMVAVHNAALWCLRLAATHEQTFEGRDAFTNRATKLLRVFTAQVEALTKYRGKGEQ